MRAEVEGGLWEDPPTPTNAKSPWLSLNDGSDAVILDEPEPDMSQRARISDLGMRDELDLTTYGFALRVAYIINVLNNGPRARSSGATSPTSTSLQTPVTTHSPGSPTSYFANAPTSPGSSTPLATSPSSETPSRKSVIFGRKKSMTPVKATETIQTEAGGKLPKEILTNGFWDILGNEGGDSMWRSTVNTFLSHLPNKKATKTNSGTNLRYVPLLIESFDSAYLAASSLTPALRRGTSVSISLPNTAGGTSPVRSGTNVQGDSKAVHLAHFIALLQTAITNHYSPLNKKIDDRERDVFNKLRVELEYYASLQEPRGNDRVRAGSSTEPEDVRFSRLSISSANGSSPLSPSVSIPPVPSIPSAYRSTSFTNKSAGSPPSSPQSVISGLATPSQMSTAASSVRSGITSTFMGTSGADLIDVVRRVWGVDGAKLRSDLDALKRAGLDEKAYLSDLKQHLTELKADPRSGSSATMQDRITSLQDEIATLIHGRPDLAGFTVASRSSVYTTGSDSESNSGASFFFTPSVDKHKIYQRLAERLYLLLDYETPLSEAVHDEERLLNLCGGVWGINGRSSLQLNAIVGIWRESILRGQADDERIGSAKLNQTAYRELERKQDGWGVRVREALSDFETDVSSSLDDDDRDFQSKAMEDLSSFLLEETSKATSTLFPITAIPPLAPPQSIPLVAHTLFSSRTLLAVLPSAPKAAWADSANELQAIAVSEYAVQAMSLIQSNGDVLASQEQTEDGLKGYEEMADWIACAVERAMKAWKYNIGDILDPPAIILSRQLPLFLAELQAFDQPQQGRKAEVIFGLYEKTARLFSLWDDVLPNIPCDFDMDAFFEPHVMEWLRATEEVDTHDWVSQAVGMDSWVPEGNLRHSQSVLDLFDFIRRACQTVLHELPLQPYRRAYFLIDLSKTSAKAINQYALTVQNLFNAELDHANPSTPTSEAVPVVNNKASAWLVKGKQAVKSFERKKADSFIIPPASCVKITNMIAAKQCTEDLGFALDSAETSRIVKEHRSKNGMMSPHAAGSSKYTFNIVVERGENLYGRNLTNPADAFVTLSEPASTTRIHKTKTVMSQIDPTWEEDFQYGISSFSNLEVSCYNRSLVGKNELIGSASLRLDPLAYRETPIRDIAISLNPRGTIHLRVELETGDRHEVDYHLNVAKRTLDRVANDMIRNLIDKMSETIRAHISLTRAREIIKPLTMKPKKGMSKPTALTDQEYEDSLLPLFDYFDTCFSTFNVTFPDRLRVDVMTAVWKRVVEMLLSILIPPLSDKESHAEAPSPQEVTVVFQWLKLLKSFFNAAENGQEHGVPSAALQAGGYRDILLVGQYLDLPTPSLKEKCSAAIKGAGRVSSPKATRPVFSATDSSFNVGGQVKPNDEERIAELLLRVLRMRPQTQEFLSQHVAQLNAARAAKNNR